MIVCFQLVILYFHFLSLYRLVCICVLSQQYSLPALLLAYVNSTWSQLFGEPATILPLPHRLPVAIGLRLQLNVTFYVSSESSLVVLPRVCLFSLTKNSMKKNATAVRETAVDGKRRLSRWRTWTKLCSTGADKRKISAISPVERNFGSVPSARICYVL